MEEKYITQYLNKETYCILVPIYYEFEEKPAWRKVFVGTEEECKNVFINYPDYMKASEEENKKHRENIFKEYTFLLSIKKFKKAQKIKEQYRF